MPRIKKPSKTEQITHLTNLLNLRCSELEELIGREKEVYRTLGGVGGEHPLDRAKRVVAERSTLADKVLLKVAEASNFENDVLLLRNELSQVRGKMIAIRAISES